MAGFSTSLANAIINNTLRGLVMPTTRNVYFALFTADPTDAFTSGTEVQTSTSPWYIRMLAGAFSAPSNGQSFNTTQVVFAPLTGVSVTITHVGIVEGANATDVTATLLYSQPLTVAKTLTVNDVYVIDSTGSTGDWTQILL